MGLQWERKERRRALEIAIRRAWVNALSDALSDYDAADHEEILNALIQWERDFSCPLPVRNEKELAKE